MPRKFPKWYDDAIALRAEGKTLEQVRDSLRSLGFNVSINSLWKYLTPKGLAHLQRTQSPEWKLRMREYARTRYRKANSNG